MGSSRRDFLKKGSLVALAAGVPMSLAEKALGKARVEQPVELGLTSAAFLAQLNTDFHITDGATRVAVKLVEVTELPRRGASAKKEAFALLFRGDRATALKQSTYLIEHEKLGLFSFLVVPVMNRERSAPSYEVIVNRLHP